MPPPDTRAVDVILNERFARDPAHHPGHHFVLFHQFDGYEDDQKPWAPCAADSRSHSCRGPRTAARRQRVSASIVFAGLYDQTRRARIPTFSFDGGVVLQPAYTRPLCAYGTDGSTDDGNGKALSCATVADGCLPGCSDLRGGAPAWCDRERPHDEGAWLTCGFGWGSHGVRPWRGDELGGAGGFLDTFRRHGDAFTGHHDFKGYNEIVVESDTWLRNLPRSVEAIFYLECQEGEANTQYSGADGRGPAKTCAEAQKRAIAAHRKYLETYGLDSHAFPMLKLTTTEWSAPFVAMPSVNADVVRRSG